MQLNRDFIYPIVIYVNPEKETTVAQPLNILVVEDNPVNQTVAVRLLEREGHQVSLANDGQEGVDAVQKENFDLVFMDIQMPVLDGVGAVKAIRALGGKYATLPVVALTANVMRGDSEQYMAAGMNACLGKPIDRQQLRSVLEKYGAGPAVAAAPPPPAPVVEASAADVDLSASLDLQALDGLKDALGRDMMDNLVGLFLSDVVNRLNNIAAAAQDHNVELLEREAHTLKGMASNLAAMPLSQKAAEIVTDCREGHVDVAIGKIDQLPPLSDGACTALKAWLQKSA